MEKQGDSFRLVGFIEGDPEIEAIEALKSGRPVLSGVIFTN